MNNNMDTENNEKNNNKMLVSPQPPNLQPNERDVNIGLDLLANSEKHVPVVNSPRIEVKLPEASIINSKPIPSLVVVEKSNILSPHKVWSDVNSQIKFPSNNNISRVEKKPIINNIEIDIEPDHIILKPELHLSQPQKIDSPRIPINSTEENIKVNKPKSPIITEPEPTVKELYFKKVDLLQKLNKIKRMGYVIPELTTSDDYDTIKIEYEKIKKMRQSENSIKFSRKMLLAIVTAIEFLNNKFDPFDIELNGWSESVNENVEDYDDVFEALSEKYKGTSNMAPELKLLLMLGGSGFMFHLSNSMFKKMQNPDNMLNGMMENLMGGLSGPGGPSGPSKNSNPMRGGLGGGNNRENHNRENHNSHNTAVRKEMSGPSGVDDILQHLQTRTKNSNKEPSISSRSRKNKSKGVSLNL
jgi:hypothetical protein